LGVSTQAQCTQLFATNSCSTAAFKHVAVHGRLDRSLICECSLQLLCYYLVLLVKLSQFLLVRCTVLCHSGSIVLSAEPVSMECSCPIMVVAFKLCMAVCVLQAALPALLCRALAGSGVVGRVGFGIGNQRRESAALLYHYVYSACTRDGVVG
jgi:hypothetical protein